MHVAKNYKILSTSVLTLNFYYVSMGNMDIALLKAMLAVQSTYFCEDAMIAFVTEELERMGVHYDMDQYGNVYATKGTTSECYPFVCAHLDTVHSVIGETPRIVEIDNGKALAACTKNYSPIGCGGDDKAGVFACLEMLKQMPVLKAAFWVAEEIGCFGSSRANPYFCKDIGYCIEFDSPNGDIISYSCDGVKLFDHAGNFASQAIPILDSHGMRKWQRHPYTDVAPLRRHFEFECLNLPVGYHNMHSDGEYVVLSEVENAICTASEVINSAGFGEFHLSASFHEESAPKREITGLILG